MKILQELQERRRREYVDPGIISSVYAELDDRDQAFAWLERSYEERSVWMAFLKVEPKFDRLRSDDRFRNLVRRVGLAP